MAGAIGKGRIYGTTTQQRYVHATKFFAVIVYLGYVYGVASLRALYA